MNKMENKVQKFDPSTLMQGVKDRIKSEFVSLIPDEQWSQMVEKEVNDFFKEKETGYSNSRMYASDFGILVREELRKEAQKRLTDYIGSLLFDKTYGQYGAPITSQKVKELMVENGGLMLQNMFGGMFSAMLSEFSQNLRNKQY
jgi:hypothetical protein